MLSVRAWRRWWHQMELEALTSSCSLQQPPAATELRLAAGREQARAASKTPGPAAALTAPSSAGCITVWPGPS